MLIWINGPFGVGKTQTAFELAHRGGGVVCDPEAVGFGLHRAMPRELRRNFQDFPAWRQGVVEVLDHVLRRREGLVVAPMTVVEPRYFEETVGRLRELGHDVRHVTLLASRETVVHRLRGRVVGHVVAAALERRMLRRETFALRALDRCLAELPHPRFAVHVQTDTLGVREVVEAVAEVAGVPLEPDRTPPPVAALRRALVGVRHVRLG